MIKNNVCKLCGYEWIDGSEGAWGEDATRVDADPSACANCKRIREEAPHVYRWVLDCFGHLKGDYFVG